MSAPNALGAVVADVQAGRTLAGALAMAGHAQDAQLAAEVLATLSAQEVTR